MHSLLLFLQIFRIGHENFELINHDVVEPLLIEGKVYLEGLQLQLNLFHEM
jgi:hypothetical protein